jgi:hypothetical protein
MKDAEMPDKNEPSVQTRNWERFLSVAVSTVAILAFPFLIYQSCLLRKTNDIAIEGFEASKNAERAHVLFQKITVHGIRELAEGNPLEGENIFITYSMKNYGNTPAWTKNIALKVLVAPEKFLPLSPNYDNAISTQMKYPILPDNDFDTFERIKIENYPVTTDQAKDILAGKQFLFVYGFIEYHDVFDNRRTSHFAYWYRFNFHKDKTGDASDFPEPTGTRDYWEYK